jgi:hypothetical protein
MLSLAKKHQSCLSEEAPIMYHAARTNNKGNDV